MLIDGRKFSGSAYYHGARTSYHHGTLMVDVDPEKLGRYLSPSKAKLEAKGVQSVRSRVTNLKEHGENVTVQTVKDAMKAAFAQVYGLAPIPCPAPDAAVVEQLRQRNASWEWNYGQKLPFSAEFESRFPWGGIQICLQVENGIVTSAKVYSDSMDWSVAPMLEPAFCGCRFEKDALQAAVPAHMENAEDIRSLFTNEM
jgi:lipoate-protein ligase A